MPDNLVTNLWFKYTVKIPYFDQVKPFIGICEKEAGIGRNKSNYVFYYNMYIFSFKTFKLTNQMLNERLRLK